MLAVIVVIFNGEGGGGISTRIKINDDQGQDDSIVKNPLQYILFHLLNCKTHLIFTNNGNLLNDLAFLIILFMSMMYNNY